MAGTYDQFFHDLAVRESVGVFDSNASPNYQALGANGLNYLGAYQFNEWSLINVGYYTNDGNPNVNTWQTGFWTGKDGINSEQDYLNNPAVQDKAAHLWMQDYVWGFVTNLGLDKYIGQTIGGINITASGLLAGAHLRGAPAVQQFITSGGQTDLQDPYGTPVSQYLSHFANYQTPFDPAPNGSASNSSASATPAPPVLAASVSTPDAAAPASAGTNDTLVLHVSADNWNGGPQFLVSVDGQQQGGVQSASASHANGQTQDITISGAFGAGTHDIGVTFFNDAWGGTDSTDRNLYVNSVDFDGQHYGAASAALYQNGTSHFVAGAANSTAS